jgi:hypothetical protein
MKKMLILPVFAMIFSFSTLPASAQGVFYGGNCQPCVTPGTYGGGSYVNGGYVNGGGYFNNGGIINPYFVGPNTSALGAARHNEYTLQVWNTTKNPIEVFLGKKKWEVKPGNRWIHTVRAASIGAGLSSTNWLREDWLTEVMIAIRKKGSTDEPVFKKISQIISNQLSYSKRELTIVAKDDGKGGLALSQPAVSDSDDQ